MMTRAEANQAVIGFFTLAVAAEKRGDMRRAAKLYEGVNDLCEGIRRGDYGPPEGT